MPYQGAVAAQGFAPAAYAYPQPAVQQQPGLLQPGQIINVNGIIVTVERYLSQGGFAHVYIVQSQAPINGTRQHVLKRMAVPDDSMLREVKQEVDVMKLLRGHPNIVNIVDASSQPMGNGAHEVFILMELCSGGGIIDMMNRRLRERLTEAEILQIFVDVCEGLAFMHNLQPPLLHRDLKVENILQASATTFKLCDFGSATPTSLRAPSTSAELRALEADLNRHTTLQYRAPEMVDVYLRRPVDEKSDIWALGVLLYKLCYYTTPFEEHGPLAILNVSYRTPPYPVYSAQMNALIASMLREHGTQRPTVFELLDIVHRMRGTQSKFRYNRPSTVANARPAPVPDMSNLIQHRIQPSQNKVAHATAPTLGGDDILGMRRGRPSHAGSLIPSPMPLSPIKSGPSRINESQQRYPAVRMEVQRFGNDQTLPQKTATPPVTSPPVWSPPPITSTPPVISGRRSPSKFDNKFDSVFISSTLGTGKPAPVSSLDDLPPSQADTRPPVLPNRTRPTAPARMHHRTGPALAKPRDAFEGLNSGYPSRPAPQTLGSQMASNKATTLDIPTNSAALGPRSPSAPFASQPGQGNTGGSYLNTTSYQQAQQPPGSPRLPPRPRDNASAQGDLSADERFPSLEELDRRFSPQPIRERPSSPKRPPSSSAATNLQLGPNSNSLNLISSSPAPPSQPPIQRSQSPSRNRPLPSYSTQTPHVHPHGPRARSPPVPSKDQPTGSLSLSEAAGRLDGSASTPSSRAQATGIPSLPSKPNGLGSRFTTVNGGGVRLPGLAPSSTGKAAPSSSSSSSEASSSTASNALSRRQSLQARPSYLRTPSSPVVSKKPPPRDWLTGDDDGVSDASANAGAAAPAPTVSRHERRTSTIASPRKDAGGHPTRIPSITGSHGNQSPRKLPGMSGSSTPVGRPAAESLRTPQPPARSDTHLSAESSGGEDGPEKATPNAKLRKPPTSQSASSRPPVSPIRSSPAGGSLARQDDTGRPSHLRKPSSNSFLNSRPAGPSRRQSVQDMVDAMKPPGQLTPRKQTSTGDLMDLGPPSPIRAAARTPRPAPSAEDIKSLKPGPSNTQFTVGMITPMPSSPTPMLSAPIVASSKKPLAGGPRARPQSLFLPTSDSFLRPPAGGDPSPSSASRSDQSDTSPTNERPRAQRRLSISDMVHKFESMNTGGDASPLPSPTQPAHRIPSGGARMYAQGTGAKVGGGSKPPVTKPPSLTQLRTGGRSPIEPTFSGAGQRPPSADGTPKPYQRLTERRVPQTVNLTGSGSTPQPPELVKPTPEPGFGRLNIVPPPDFLGTAEAVTAASRAGRRTPPPASPSPERPYQGVGKLIAQWHQKAEANDNAARKAAPGRIVR